jgi:hypothetical protein
MANSEGIRRIMLAGKFLMLFGFIPVPIIVILVIAVPQLSPLQILILPFISLALLGGLIRGVGWIIEGFSQ